MIFNLALVLHIIEDVYPFNIDFLRYVHIMDYKNNVIVNC